MKIESVDKSYSREYTKSEVEGIACKDIEFLGDIERIKECGGATVSILTNNEEVSDLQQVDYELFDVSLNLFITKFLDFNFYSLYLA
jgi:hypothetical protein